MQTLAAAQSYASVLKKALTQSNPNYSKFVWVTYPTSNNGILSMGKSHSSKYDPLKQRICPTYTCLGLSEDLIDDPSNSALNNLVTFDAGDASSLQEDQVNKSVLNAALPSILNVIGLNLNSSRQKAVKMDLSFGGLVMREILPAEVRGYLDSIQPNPNASLTQRSVANQYRRKQLSIITKDIVIDKMKLTVEVISDNNFGVEAALEQKVGSIFGKDSTIKFQISKQGNRKYSIETTRPMIIARFYQNAKDLPE